VHLIKIGIIIKLNKNTKPIPKKNKDKLIRKRDGILKIENGNQRKCRFLRR